jgi:DNA modification methylase
MGRLPLAHSLRKCTSYKCRNSTCATKLSRSSTSSRRCNTRASEELETKKTDRPHRFAAEPDIEYMLINETFTKTSLDRESVPQSNLDIANRVRTNLLPWAGQFSPQLVEELLAAHGQRAGVVMDPFVGSGTSLVEASRLGKAAWGNDINPAAAILARVYCLVNVGVSDREAALDSLENRLLQIFEPYNAPLFSNQSVIGPSQADQESALVRLWRESATEVSRILAAALVVLCDFHRQDLSTVKVRRNWLRLAEVVRSLPVSSESVVVFQADARELPIESDSVDLVLTSPPYINVHNYHQKFRRSVEALGWNVLTIAPSEIGSNRQNRGNRFVTVIQYALDMVLAIREMVRVARPEARLILVLGRESTVRHVPFFNGELVAELAVRGVGLDNERRQERQFVNRYGSRIREDILHFRTSSNLPDKGFCLEAARAIACQTLSATRQLTATDARKGIDDALSRIDIVSPSPLPSNEDLSQVLS